MNGYSEGCYNIIVTQYQPDDFEHYLNECEIIYDKKKMNGKYQVGSGRIVTFTHDTPFIDDSLSNSDGENNGKNVNNDGVQMSEKDSEGNTLSKGQIEFFKDSVAKDEDGRLLAVYHGTPNKNVNEFSYDFVGPVGGSNHGYGFYFTDNQREASLYAQGVGEVKKAYINITAPIYSTATDFTNKLDELFSRLPMYAKNSLADRHGSVDDAKHYYTEYISKNGNGTFLSTFPDKAGLRPAVFNNILGNMGYDGVIHKEEGYSTEYVLFESSQAKLTTNKNPTSNPDINFSEKDTGTSAYDIIGEKNALEKRYNKLAADFANYKEKS